MRIIKKIKAVSLLMALLFSFSGFSQEEAIHWVSFAKAVELTRTKPKPIIIDIYTTWCGPCKMMSKNTFGNPVIAKFINQHYYAVKFDAENFDTLKFVMLIPDTTKDKKGKVLKTGIKKQLVVYINPAPKGTPRAPHQFANAILDGNLSYPSIVFLNEKVERIDVVKGYYPPNNFEPIVKYIGSGAYIKTKYDQYLKTFKGEL